MTDQELKTKIGGMLGSFALKEIAIIDLVDQIESLCHQYADGKIEEAGKKVQTHRCHAGFCGCVELKIEILALKSH